MNKIILSSICVAILCSCGLTKKDLGLEKDTPNEMMVVARKPLSIPPEFGLRPLIVTDNVSEANDLSAGEKEFLEKIK